MALRNHSSPQTIARRHLDSFGREWRQEAKRFKVFWRDCCLEESWQEIRGLDVYDITDEQIANVEYLYVDQDPRFASSLIMSAGGLLGIGKKHFLTPVKEVSRDGGEERVTITVPQDKVLSSPGFDPDVGVPAPDL